MPPPSALAATAGAIVMVALAIGCAQDSAGPRSLSQPQQLCSSWGYDPNDPVCLRTFRRDPP